MTGDWTAVASAINQRMTELGLSQGEVIKRSGLAKQTVSDIQNNTIQRNRSRRTLEALSGALDWHLDHLAAVLEGRTPPEVGMPYTRSTNDIPKRFDILEHRLDRMRDELKEADAAREERFDEFKKEILGAVQQIMLRLRQPGR